MYQRYGGGNMDEGWTRFVLEQCGFPYTSIMDTEIKAGGLEAKYDVIILPSDSVAAMTGERPEGAAAARGRRLRRAADEHPARVPQRLRQGRHRGAQIVRPEGRHARDVRRGRALPIERFGLPLRNVVADRKPVEFWCPGSTLRVRVRRTTHPLAYGMPSRGARGVPRRQPGRTRSRRPTKRRERDDRTFVDRDMLQSGWLLGESVIAKKAAMVSVKQGDGRVVLIGFRPQHRAQTHGTFKLVFNALLDGAEARRTRTTEQAASAGR